MMIGSSSGEMLGDGVDGPDSNEVSDEGVDIALRVLGVFAMVSPSVVRNKECALWAGLPAWVKGIWGDAHRVGYRLFADTPEGVNKPPAGGLTRILDRPWGEAAPGSYERSGREKHSRNGRPGPHLVGILF